MRHNLVKHVNESRPHDTDHGATWICSECGIEIQTSEHYPEVSVYAMLDKMVGPNYILPSEESWWRKDCNESIIAKVQSE